MLQRGGKPFTTSVARYRDHLSHHGADGGAKITVKFSVPSIPAALTAILDTGAQWSALDPEVAEATGALQRDGVTVSYSTRFGTIVGKLVRTELVLEADEGASLLVNATVFVSTDWPSGRNFIGYSGFLERIRFGVDPEANQFHFGPL